MEVLLIVPWRREFSWVAKPHDFLRDPSHLEFLDFFFFNQTCLNKQHVFGRIYPVRLQLTTSAWGPFWFWRFHVVPASPSLARPSEDSWWLLIDESMHVPSPRVAILPFSEGFVFQKKGACDSTSIHSYPWNPSDPTMVIYWAFFFFFPDYESKQKSQTRFT